MYGGALVFFFIIIISFIFHVHLIIYTLLQCSALVDMDAEKAIHYMKKELVASTSGMDFQYGLPAWMLWQHPCRPSCLQLGPSRMGRQRTGTTKNKELSKDLIQTNMLSGQWITMELQIWHVKYGKYIRLPNQKYFEQPCNYIALKHFQIVILLLPQWWCQIDR